MATTGTRPRTTTRKKVATRKKAATPKKVPTQEKPATRTKAAVRKKPVARKKSAAKKKPPAAATIHSPQIAARIANPDPAWAGAVVFTIGHSTRPHEEFVALLRRHGVVTLADIRTVPRSRHNPQFGQETLAVTLPAAGIAYTHLARLGGLRRGLGDASPNKGWRNTSFRGYADYMQTAEFREGLEELRALVRAGPVATMCAEAVPWRCHRSLVADALLVRGVESRDIQSLTRAAPHKLTPFARVEGERITYPPYEDEAEDGAA